MRNVIFSALVVTSTCLGFAATASAHARLVQSDPANGASLDAAPSVVTLSFSEGLEPAFSHVILATGSGDDVPLREQKVAGDDGSLITAVPLKPLSAGSYEARWDVLSRDGHKTSGAIRFTVEP